MKNSWEKWWKIRIIPFHQGGTRHLRHHYCTLKAHRVRGRNTENYLNNKDEEMAKHHGRWHVVMKFIHEEKHIVFQDIGKGRRKKEVLDVVVIVVAMSA